jgi:choline dehydrogenase
MLPTGLLNNYAFRTVSQSGLDGRRGYQPRGKTLGGSSSINALVYARGHYDHWAKLGNAGWSYEDVLPYFKRAESNEHFINDRFHGTSGPLNVVNPRSPSKLNDAFIRSAEVSGIQQTVDYNGERQEGCFHYQVAQKDG